MVLLQVMKAGRGGWTIFDISLIRFLHCAFFGLLLLNPRKSSMQALRLAMPSFCPVKDLRTSQTAQAPHAESEWSWASREKAVSGQGRGCAVTVAGGAPERSTFSLK